jgi:hypothetical protein
LVWIRVFSHVQNGNTFAVRQRGNLLTIVSGVLSADEFGGFEAVKGKLKGQMIFWTCEKAKKHSVFRSFMNDLPRCVCSRQTADLR